jgi:chromosome segregation protein
MKGFKSFADKTIINFSESVIGVVGSNGCGKSNIVDAIRWVLGEQKTSQLRSDSMTNVIFNGTKQRKASGLAEVALVFENNKGILPLEYQEVSIKRTLYQDGSSEYRLNDIKCRLKDIQNLLADTGMTSDSYAIIALGMVDELLQDKDNARSRLFEQAAGISKYKVRKKETLSKLRSTDEDLTRTEDLLAEIDKNLKVLERQAKRAKKYFELKDLYRQQSIEWHIFKINHLKNQYKQLEQQIKQEHQQGAEMEKMIAQLEQQIERERQAQGQQEQAYQQKQQELQRLTAKIKTRENDLKLLSQKNLFIEENNQRVDQRIEAAKQRLNGLQEQQRDYQEQQALEQELLADLQEQLLQAKQQLEQIRNQHQSAKQDLDQFIRQQSQLNNQIFEQEKQIAIHQNQQENARRQVERLQSQLQQRNQEKNVWAEQAQDLADRIEGQETLLFDLREKEQQRQEALRQAEEQWRSCQDQLQVDNRQLDAKNNEYKLLKSLVESLEGFSESIKFLHKNRSWSADAPLLSDLLYCPAEYRTAIENYLEQYLSYYVVATTDEAIEAIRLLDQHQKGKANFFILDQIPQAAANAHAHSLGQAALDLVQVDEPYQGLMQQLLADVRIVGSQAEVPSQVNGTVWLTQDGKFSQKAYALRGGSVGAFEGKKIGRKKNLELLEQQIQVLQEKVEAQRRTEQSLRQRQQELRGKSYQNEIQRADQQLQQLLREQIGLKGKLDNHRHFETETQQQLQQQSQQISQWESQIGQALGLKAQLQEQAQALTTSIEEKDSAYSSIAQRLQKASNEYNQKNIELVRQQNRLSSVQREAQFTQKQLEELQAQVQKDLQTLAEGGTELKSTKELMLEAEENLREWSEERRDLAEEVQAAEKNYFQGRGQLSALEEELRLAHRKNQHQMQLIMQLEQQFSEIKLQLSNIAERLKVEFELSINDLMNRNPNEELDPQALQQEVEQLQKQLQNFGPINPTAVEAYDEMLQRFDFIQQQRQDLLHAKETLLQTIQEIESKATEKFLAAFTEARGHFIQVFRSLFLEDDTCDLVLCEPDRPLESAIDIIAKPKGKRPLSINQLSGGEKTLTATALLFALYLLKPAPFCIFDEVDAPLDDVNIAKFNNIIKDFSRNSQFIIVTHNKKTMEAVDIMYGVTMIQGVSKVVPVDFRGLDDFQVG